MIVIVEIKKEEPRAIVEAEAKRKQEVMFAMEPESEHKINKHGTSVKLDLEGAEKAKATGRIERRKKQERGVAETFLERKPSEQVVTVMNESDMEEEKKIVHSEPKKNKKEGDVKESRVERREEKKDWVSVVRKKLERKKDENMGFVKPKHEKKTQVPKEEENCAAKTVPEVKEEAINFAKVGSEKEAAKIMVKPDARKNERERIKEMQELRNVGAHMKEIQEEGEEDRRIDNNLDQKVMNSMADNKIKENPEKEKMAKKMGSKMSTEGENVYSEDHPHYWYARRNNEYYHGSSSYHYAPQSFSDDNPNAWCSIQ